LRVRPSTLHEKKRSSRRGVSDGRSVAGRMAGIGVKRYRARKGEKRRRNTARAMEKTDGPAWKGQQKKREEERMGLNPERGQRKVATPPEVSKCFFERMYKGKRGQARDRKKEKGTK